jgi:hypothetical protein
VTDAATSVPRPRTTGAGVARRWRAPAVQAAVLAAVLSVDGYLVLAAQADLRADQGRGPTVAAAKAPRAAAPPVTLGIPDLEITTRLIGLRKDRDGALQVPEDAQRAGWYSQGLAPGDDGPAVIVGHVDSYRGPGIFAGLKRLQPGQVIRVRRADGSLVTFAVREVKEYAKRDFPTEQVYRGDGTPTLRLVTCGGEFDRGSRSYRSNVVVFADLVSQT